MVCMVCLMVMISLRLVEMILTLLKQNFKVRRTGHIGFASDCDTETDVFKRTIRIDRERGRIELEAERRHAQVLAEMVKLQKAMAAATPPATIDGTESARIAASDREGCHAICHSNLSGSHKPWLRCWVAASC